MNRSRIIVLLLAALLALAVPARAAGQTVTDTLGRQRQVPLPLTRVVALGVFAGEALCALGAGQAIVGRSQWVVWPPALRRLPSLGQPEQINLELLLELRPQAVIADSHFLGAARVIEAAGIPMLFIDGFHLADVSPGLKLLGRWFNRQQRAERLARFLDQREHMIRSRVAGLSQDQRPLVFSGFGRGILRTYSDLAGEHLLTVAGGRNLAGGLPVMIPRISVEWLLQQDPDFVLLTADLNQTGFQAVERSRLAVLWQEAASRPGIRRLRAVKEHHLYIYDGRLGYGLRSIIKALYMAKWFHPDLFKDLDPAAEHRRLVAGFFGLELQGAFVYP